MEINHVICAGDLVKHYKGSLYRIESISAHTETLETMINYRLVGSGDGRLWSRPRSMFYDIVEYEGKSIQRFTRA